jgi:threonine 3-dehydrogenase
MAAAIVRHAGAKHVVVSDLSDYRLGLAKAAGADLCVNVGKTRIADAQRDLGMREGFDIGLEMSGAPSAVTEMLANLNHGAKVAMLGLPKDPYPIDWGRVITHMITIKGIYGREMFETWYLMSSMLASSSVLADAIRSVITHRFPAQDWAEAFATARSGECGKVILDWS